jgi:hypothetical protein
MALMKEHIVATIDLANQSLKVDDKVSKEKVVDVITKAGYIVK